MRIDVHATPSFDQEPRIGNVILLGRFAGEFNVSLQRGELSVSAQINKSQRLPFPDETPVSKKIISVAYSDLKISIFEFNCSPVVIIKHADWVQNAQRLGNVVIEFTAPRNVAPTSTTFPLYHCDTIEIIDQAD